LIDAEGRIVDAWEGGADAEVWGVHGWQTDEGACPQQ